MAKTFYLKSFVIAGLRRLTYKYPPRSESLRDAKIERGLYQCASCKKVFKKKDVCLDHIEPVVPVTGFTNWDDYINRMFPPKSGWQVLCKEVCHKTKSNLEDNMRSIHRNKKK